MTSVSEASLVSCPPFVTLKLNPGLYDLGQRLTTVPTFCFVELFKLTETAFCTQPSLALNS